MMASTLTLFISVGLVVSLLFSEFFGIAAGGLIVPGYMALYLDKPLTALNTLALGYLTYLVVRVLSTFTIIYGRRRVAVTILVGYMLGMAARHLFKVGLGGDIEIAVVGYIVPGLIALWMERQGVFETATALITASIVVRLVMILVTGGEW